uniref:Uncharacterized protein n=1 Tax=Anguilla anguilla TaxID=7936 RepID=A0A0E9TYU2_ANGAN
MTGRLPASSILRFCRAEM